MFPNGIDHYLIGGLLIGVATSLIYVFTGKLAGTSTFFTSTWSWFSQQEFFQKKKYVGSRDWRLVFTVGIILGALIYAFTSDAFFTTQVQPWRMFAGGLLVGFGTRMSSGCTSGHGICGMSAGSRESIVSVITFLLVAIGTALLIQSFGVFP